jgi:hypothetical protein
MKLKEIYNSIKYTVYEDLDGCLADFDKKYFEVTGISTHHADSQGKNKFWEILKDGLEKKKMTEQQFWETIEWMPDGKELWSYIKKYKPIILTAPSRNKESIIGKSKWVKKYLGYPPVIFRSAKQKHLEAGENKILIDDRKDTIERWINAGGIGIHHISTNNTIKELKKLGL